MDGVAKDCVLATDAGHGGHIIGLRSQAGQEIVELGSTVDNGSLCRVGAVVKRNQVFRRHKHHACNRPTKVGRRTSDMCNIDLGNHPAARRLHTSDRKGEPGPLDRGVGHKLDGQRTRQGSDARNSRGTAGTLIQRRAACAYAVKDIQIVISRLGILIDVHYHRRIFRRGHHNQGGIAARGIIARGTTVVVYRATAGIYGVIPRCRHIVCPRSDQDRSFPETHLGTAVGTQVSLVHPAGRQVGTHIEGIGDILLDMQHAVDRGADSVIAQFPGARGGSGIPCKIDAVDTC